MTVHQSTGVIATLYAALPDLLAGGAIFIYGDEQPANADQPALADPLARITVAGGEWTPDNTAAGLHLIADGRFVVKDPTEDWRMVGMAAGMASWWRFVPGSNDTTLRIDGSCALADSGDIADMYLPNLAITPDTNTQVNSWVLSVPPLT